MSTKNKLDERTEVLIKPEKDTSDNTKKEEDEKIPDYGGLRRLQRDYGKGLGCYTFFGYIFSLLNGFIIPAFALVFRELMNILGESIGEDGNTNFSENILYPIFYFVGIGVGALIFTLLQYFFWGVYGIKIAIKVREIYFNVLCKQEIGYHDQKTSGLINSEFMTECEAIENGVGLKKGILFQHFGTFAFGIGLSFYYSVLLTLVLMATIPALICIGILQGIMIHGTSPDADPFAKSGGFSQEVFTNIRIVKSFPYMLRQKYKEYSIAVIEAAPIARKRELIMGIGFGAMMFGIIGIMYSVGLYAGASFVDKGNISSADFFGAFFAFMMAGIGLGQMGSVTCDITKAKIAANKFYHLNEREIKIKESKLPKDKLINNKQIKGVIQFKNVTFAYPTAPDKIVLNNVSFTVNAGESLAIVGPSGSGKTTCVALLERYYDPNSGEILIDGIPIEDYDINFLRNNIGLVSQNPLLFDASISENIRAGTDKDKATTRDITEAAQIANADEFIKSFENGYEQRVGELGGRLSGGQRQRIVIARALLNKPSILLLDEATSALDSKNEKDVQKALDKINKLHSQTTISIAHRLSTIKDHTNILVLVNGKVSEYGPHDQLIKNGEVYAALVKAQELVK